MWPHSDTNQGLAFLPFLSLPCREFLGPLNLLVLPEAKTAAGVGGSSPESEIAKFD